MYQEEVYLERGKYDKPENYLGAALSQMDNDQGYQCWTMSSGKYCDAFINNVEEHLASKGLRLPSKCKTPFTSGYKPEIDTTGELKPDGVQWYQELIGSLRWEIEVGRVDILLETSLLSRYLALPREGHLEQALHIIGYIYI